MQYPQYRARRLRRTPALRRMVRETTLHASDLIYPLFSAAGLKGPQPIPSMPGIEQLPIKKVVEQAQQAYELGIPAVLLFGLPAQKDPLGKDAYSADGIIQQTIRALKEALPELVVITDVCLCEYTDHGHCGVLRNGEVDNDATLELLAAEAVSHARAGADIVAPSDMMDGRVAYIRHELDRQGYERIPVMSYAVKYASAYYGPFREAADSTPQSGDRRGYQMDPANRREAWREAQLDVSENADFLMVKPALAYMDVIADLRQRWPQLPLVAYNVSGEYSLVKAGAEKGWLDEKAVVLESLTAMKRAGADLLITYHALDVARWLGEEAR